jgi:hypothetical protein
MKRTGRSIFDSKYRCQWPNKETWSLRKTGVVAKRMGVFATD